MLYQSLPTRNIETAAAATACDTGAMMRDNHIVSRVPRDSNLRPERLAALQGADSPIATSSRPSGSEESISVVHVEALGDLPNNIIEESAVYYVLDRSGAARNSLNMYLEYSLSEVGRIEDEAIGVGRRREDCTRRGHDPVAYEER